METCLLIKGGYGRGERSGALLGPRLPYSSNHLQSAASLRKPCFLYSSLSPTVLRQGNTEKELFGDGFLPMFQDLKTGREEITKSTKVI